jgi:hypothetical protein
MIFGREKEAKKNRCKKNVQNLQEKIFFLFPSRLSNHSLLPDYKFNFQRKEQRHKNFSVAGGASAWEKS